MKVLLAHKFYNPVGGAEVFYREVGRVLSANGHQVAYFSMYEEGTDTHWKKYFPRSIKYKNNNIFSGILNIKRMIYSVEAKDNFEKLLHDFKPDIVHVFAIYIHLSPSILDACRENRIPVVMSCNDYKHICPNYKLFHHGHVCEDCKGGNFYNTILNKCAQNSLTYSVASCIEAYVHDRTNIYRKNVSLFLFASQFMLNKTKEFWGESTFDSDILQNPFESNKYPLSTDYRDYILFFGRLVEEKGVDILLKSMKLIPDCKLKIIGIGPDEQKLKDLSKKLMLSNVEFCGSKWGTELESILKKARFVVVPSIWYENFPYVVLQSFAYGKAVIGSSYGGIPELVINEKYGLVYNALDSKELARKILYLWKNPGKAVEMGVEAKTYIDLNFNDKLFYEKLINIYLKVLK